MPKYTNIRDTVLEAALAMELKLRKYDEERGKRGWLNMDPLELIDRVRGELQEAVDEIEREDCEAAARELVDVLNLAMMARDALLDPDPEERDCYEQWVEE